MQIVIKNDTVIASYKDDVTVPMDQFPGARLAPYFGPAEDIRPNEAPPEIDRTAYTALVRYMAERRGVTAKVGDETVPVSTKHEDRNGYRDTLLAILSGLRQDGAAFKFADGLSRPATNVEVQIAISNAFGYVQMCFDKEAEIQKDLASSKPTYTTLDKIDAAFEALVA